MFLKPLSRWWSPDPTTHTHTHLNLPAKPRSHHSMAPMHSPKLDPTSRPSDFWIYRIVVGALGSTLVICTVGAISLEIEGKPTPALVSSLGTGSLAAIAGLLVPSPIKR